MPNLPAVGQSHPQWAGLWLGLPFQRRALNPLLDLFLGLGTHSLHQGGQFGIVHWAPPFADQLGGAFIEPVTVTVKASLSCKAGVIF